MLSDPVNAEDQDVVDYKPDDAERNGDVIPNIEPCITDSCAGNVFYTAMHCIKSQSLRWPKYNKLQGPPHCNEAHINKLQGKV